MLDCKRSIGQWLVNFIKEFLSSDMSAEFPPQSAHSKEQRTEQEQILDTVLESLLSERSVRINEGNNGVIFRVDLKEIPPAVTEYVEQTQGGLQIKDDQVIKTLKIYAAGAGHYEFQLQQTAWEAVRVAMAANPDKEYAQIPAPMLDRDLPVTSDKTRDWLDQQGLTNIHDNMEILLMDYIPGHDLATVLYRELVRRHPKFRDQAFRVDLPENDQDALTDFKKLQDLVADRLSFYTPGGKSRDVGERAYEQRKVETANIVMIIKELKRCGFELHPTILKQLKNTVDLLNSQHLFLRDFHLRNAMVVGDPSADAATPPQAFVLDFGRAIQDDSLTPDEMARPSEGVKYMRDDTVVRQLQVLLPGKEKN